MSVIAFDCLVLPDQAEVLAEAFDAVLERCEELGRVRDVSVTWKDQPAGVAEIERELIGQWNVEHPGEPVGNRSVHRYVIEFSRVSGSINELAMDLSQILTPRAELPASPVSRQWELEFENAAIYPWSVRVRP